MNRPCDPEVRHHFTDGQYIKEVFLAAGYEIKKHVHSYSHFGILVKGRAILTVNGEEQILEAPAILTVEAGSEHTVRALTAVTWLCTHALSEAEFDTNPAKIDAILIAKGK